MPCKLCGSARSNSSSCPLNPHALSIKPEKHNSVPATVAVATPAPKPKAPKSLKAMVAPAPPKKYPTPSSPEHKYQAPKVPRGQVGVRTENWKQRKPNTKKEREATLKRCGAQCFLVPEELKYPVCPKVSPPYSCNFDCDGIRAQRNITYLINNRHTVSEEAKARALFARGEANKLGVAHCGWLP